VTRGVHRVPLPLPTDGLRAVNVYVIEELDGLTLVDAGWAVGESRATLDRALRSLGYESGDVRRVLVTHIHRDHYTQAVTLRRDHGARVSLGEGEQPSLAALNDPTTTEYQVSLLNEAGASALARHWYDEVRSEARDLSLWEEPDEWLKGEVDIDLGGRVLRAIETPGHTRGHLVFADIADGLIFAGDHVLPTITPSIGYEPAPSALPLADYLASLAKMRTLPDLVLLPAHGPAGGSLHARVDELLAHHGDRLRSSHEATVGRAVTAHEVAADLPWTRRARAFATLDPFSAALAVLETRAHLDVLVATGQIERSTGSGVVRYEAIGAT
jgi:glyoxylase-like metal-dependent hydrolase (beta-lactamase superfamily II)